MAFGSISVDRITSSDYTLIENYMATSGRPLSNRNLIINGAMQVAQRGTSNTGITSSGYYTADRWRMEVNSAGTWTMNVESSAPTNTEFRKSANVICTTADSSLAASDLLFFRQRIEGQNVQGIKKGTSAAESLTVSFWVKSSNTGTYICDFADIDNTRQISKSYTINTAHTWEKKTITVPPDTTGQFDNDNGNSLNLIFWLAAGTDFTSGTLNSSAWASIVSANRVVGQLNLANAVGNYWAVTGIQLETGTVATPFEMRSPAQELQLCQRYYYNINGGDSNGFATFANGGMTTATNARALVQHPVAMRTQPTVSYLGKSTFNLQAYDSGSACTIASVSQNSTVTSYINFTASSGVTAYNPATIQLDNTTSYTEGIQFNAEL
jgi:hypothetical protein